MKNKHFLYQWINALVVMLVAASLVMVPAAAPQTVRAATPESGLVCSTNPSSTFTLTATTGHISIPDGNTVYMWGYSLGSNHFQYPGPVLCVTQGEKVTVVLQNRLVVPTSIIFPGQKDVLANGKLAQPEFDGGGVMTSFTNSAGPNDQMTYSFVASEPGTYLYQSGTDSGFQTQMGLFGSIIVRPAGHPDWAYNDSRTQFDPGTEFLILLSEVDPVMHEGIERSIAQGLTGSQVVYDMKQYVPRYWMVNGRSFPDTIAPNEASWLPYQPYSSLAHILPYAPGKAGYAQLPAVERYLSVGPTDYPFHPHGNNGRVIAQDGRELVGPANEELFYDKYTVNVAPGQTVDALFTWADVDKYDPTTNPVLVEVPGESNLTFGAYYSGSPYLGNVEPFPPGQSSMNQCGEYYHVAHNHALSKITAWGITMSGMLTYTRIDPPNKPCQ
jgi:FtsP/CotA-like multicopper oxidase with cupredoxin domain